MCYTCCIIHHYFVKINRSKFLDRIREVIRAKYLSYITEKKLCQLDIGYNYDRRIIVIFDIRQKWDDFTVIMNFPLFSL